MHSSTTNNHPTLYNCIALLDCNRCEWSHTDVQALMTAVTLHVGQRSTHTRTLNLRTQALTQQRLGHKPHSRLRNQAQYCMLCANCTTAAVVSLPLVTLVQLLPEWPVINDAILSAVNKGDKGGRRARAAIIVATAAPEGLDQAPDALIRTANATTATATATAAGGSSSPGRNRYGESDASGGSSQGRTWTLISLKMPTVIKNVSACTGLQLQQCTVCALAAAVACRQK
jgi:hypothetical protein